MHRLILMGVAFAAPMVGPPVFAQVQSSTGAPASMPRLEHLRPSYGFQLPPEWMSHEYAIDYREHGLERPARGFGWSRYYDGIVLTDQWGRVYDVVGEFDRSGRRPGRDARADGAGYRGGHWNGRHGDDHARHSATCQSCCCMGETVTTTTVTYHGGAGYMVPHEVVTYENVYAPARAKYRARAAAPAARGKTRVRTRLHTKTY